MNLYTRTSAQPHRSSQAVTKPQKERKSLKDYFTIEKQVMTTLQRSRSMTQIKAYL